LADIALVASIRHHIFKDCYFFQQFQHAAGRAQVAAPEVGDQNNQKKPAQYECCARKPERVSMLKCQFHGIKEITGSDGDGPSGIVQCEYKYDARGQNDISYAGENFFGILFYFPLEKGNF
jgi:hypothetical protein